MKLLLGVILLGLTCFDLTQARIGTFWHITDFHLDVNYTTSGDTTKMCWVANESPNKRLKIPASRLKGMNANPGKYGDYLCDAPLALIESAVDEMQKIHPDPDFIIWTGDDTAHVENKFYNEDKVVDVVGKITDLLVKRFNTTTFLPVMGNHDYHPKSQIPPGYNAIQGRVAELWSNWFTQLGGDTFKTFNASGRYLAHIEDSVVSVMGLNSLLYYHTNNETALDETADDPDGQFAWADQKLTEMKNKGRKVYLMGHIPPGSFERYQQKTKGYHWYQERYNKRFIQLVIDHSDVISGQFFGHQHTDSIKLFFSDNERGDDAKPVGYQLLAPAVTPWKSSLSEETGANNPAIRLVSYDTESGAVIEVTTYYLNLTAANIGGPKWEFEYNFTSYYNLQEISASSLFNMARDMKDDDTLFDKYYSSNTVRWEDPSVCTAKCHTLHWCTITEIDYERFQECNSAATILPWGTPLLLAIAHILWR